MYMCHISAAVPEPKYPDTFKRFIGEFPKVFRDANFGRSHDFEGVGVNTSQLRNILQRWYVSLKLS